MSSREISGSSTQSRSVSPSTPKESGIQNSGVGMAGAVNIHPNGLNVPNNERQVWGSRSSSPQTGKPSFPNPANAFRGTPEMGRTSPGTALPTENEWIAEVTEFPSQLHSGLQLGQQPQHNGSNFPQAGCIPLVVVSSEPPPIPPNRPYWFPRPTLDGPYPDNRIHPPSPPRGPGFPVAYHSPILPPNSHFDGLPMVPLTSDDIQRSFRGMPVEDDRMFHHGRPLPPNFQPGPPPPPFPPGHTPYNAYPPPDYGNYYLTQPPEPFTDYSFLFDGFRSHQGRRPYPIPHPNSINNNRYPPPPPPLHPNPGPEVGHPLIGPVSFDYAAQAPPPRFFYPSAPPHIILSPPMPFMRPNIPMASANKGSFGNNNNNQNFSPKKQPIPPSLSPRRLALPSPKGKQSGHPSTSSTQGPSYSTHRQSRRLNNFLPLTERSALLEDFRLNRDKTWDLKDMFDHIIEFSGDQYGSRFIQQNLEVANDEDKQRIFNEIVPLKTDQLVRDVFGNYVIQKFFEFGTQAQRDALAEIVEKQVVSLSLHIYGCRVVQRAIDYISEAQQTAIIRHLEQDILTCIKDAHGNHVIQKIVEVVSPERLTFLPLICDNILGLSTHPYGCRVLQRCLEHLPEEHIHALLEAIHRCTLELVQDQYGNYVIQFIIEQGREHDKSVVISQIRGNLIKLSQHKYASNVCEKALICTDSETRCVLINEIMTTPAADSENPILTMVKDQYANYVLQRALTVVEGDQRDAFYLHVKPLLVSLRKSTTTYNRPLVSIERMMDRYFGKQTSGSHSTTFEKLNRHGRSSC